jgi:L-asparaginase
MSRNKLKGEIAIFFTGGTIAMQPSPEDRGVVPTGDFDRLLTESDLHGQGVKLRPIHWADLPSPHMTPQDMFRLAKDVEKMLAGPSILGAVVVHGTDVLVESAFMADLIVDSPKPIVFTGSMRYYSELGFDGIRNLLDSIKACLLPLPPGLGVVLLMTDRLFSARDVAKINSLNIDAFEAPDSGPVGYVAGDTVLLARRPFGPSIPSSRQVLRVETIEPNVPLITCYTGMDGYLIDRAREHGAAGLIIEGFGAGNVPPAAVPSLIAAVRNKIPVVLTTRCIEGGVWPIYAYPGGAAHLRKEGIILGGRLSGPKARIKLMVALAMTRNMGQLRSIFEGD